MTFFDALLTNTFLQMAILAGFAASITSGIIGSYIVVKRIVFISGSIAHSVLGGMGFSLWLKRSYDILWLTPMHGALVAALLSSFLIGWIHLKYKEREDTVIAAIWATGMSIGVIFLALTPGYNVELSNFLFGNILWVSHKDIAILIGLDVLVMIAAAIFHRRFMAICFDEAQALLQAIPVQALYLLLLGLVAISVVLLIQVVGSILVIAMLAIPAAIANSMTSKFSKMIVMSIILSCLFIFLGTGASYELNWPPGATIALTAALFYLFSLLKTNFKRRLA